MKVKKLIPLFCAVSCAMFLAACSNSSGSEQPFVYFPPEPPETVTTYTITFNANDGTPNPATATQKFTQGVGAALTSVNQLRFSKAGFYFAGWGLTADATTAKFADEAGYLAEADKTLYAVWSSAPVCSAKTPVVAGGTVTASPASGAAGTVVTLTATPKTNCYAFESFTVVDANSNPVAVDANGRFTMPEGGVTVSATFKAVQPSSPYTVIATQQIGSSVYDIVTFGSWPQTIKSSNVEVSGQSESKTVGDFTYYMGSDGYWYAKLSDKYYKVEPIKWRVLTTSYNGTGKKLLLAESILIGKRYAASYNNYQNSEIRKWLNSNANTAAVSDHTGSGGFLNTAFAAGELAKIADANVDNSARSTNPDSNATAFNNGKNQYASDIETTDKVFLLSYQEVSTSAYGFVNASKLVRFPTDYAKARGANQSATAGGGWWWLRSPLFNYNYLARYVDGYSYSTNRNNVSDNEGCVVPALCVSD